MALELEFPVPRGRDQYSQYLQLSRIAVEMQTAGWRVDMDRAAQHKADADTRVKRLGGVFSALSGLEKLGDGQTDAVKGYFWDTLKVPVVSRDKKSKQPKLDAAALLTYATEFEDETIVKASAALYGYRKALKTISFCDDYLASGGRVHPSFNVTGTKGSRWSSSKPNIQQVPSKLIKFDFGDGMEPIAVSLKDCFIADEGFVLVDADWAALELYLQTYIAQAQKLIGCINEGRDLHMFNAQLMMGKERVPDTATKKSHKNERTVAKFAYGYAYNASDHIAQVHKQMKPFLPEIDEEMCKAMRKRYFGAHIEFPKWQGWTKDEIKRNGYIDTPLMGRRLYLPDSMRGYNQALNSQCQITGGDLANFAIIGLFSECRWDKGEQIRAQVHDSFVMQTRPEWAEETAKKLVGWMERPVKINGVTAKFVAEAGVGPSWGNLIDLPDWLRQNRSHAA